MRKYLSSRSGALVAAGSLISALLVGSLMHASAETVSTDAAPGTDWYGLSPAAFAPYDNFTAAKYAITAGFIAGSGCFGAAVHLPHHAVMKTFTVWYSTDTSGSSTSQVQALIYRSVPESPGFDQPIGYLESTNTAQVPTSMQVSLRATHDKVINNRDYVYSVMVCVNNFTYDRFYWGRITYSTAGG